MNFQFSNAPSQSTFAPSFGATNEFQITPPETESSNGQLTKASADSCYSDMARNILGRVRDTGQRYVVQPAKVALPYLDNAAHDVGWALKGCPPLRLITGILAATFRVASVMINWSVMALEGDKNSAKCDWDHLTDERNWPDDIRSALKPLLFILKGVKAIADWIVGVLDPSARRSWDTDPATYFEQTIEKVIKLSADDLKFAASKSLELPLDCLITDISRALSELGDGHKRVFNHILIDRLLENLEQSAKGDIKNFDESKRALLQLGETYEATPQSKRSMFSTSDAMLASRLTGNSNASNHKPGSDVFAVYTVAPTLIWDAVGSYAREDFVHL